MLLQALVWVATLVPFMLLCSSFGLPTWACSVIWTAVFAVWVATTWGTHGALFGVFVSPKVLLRYRGRAIGAIERYDLPRPGQPGSIRVRYEVEACEYVIEREVGTVELYRGETHDHWDGGAAGGAVVDVWDAPELGHVCLGGEIRVRYRKADPADAVLLPNKQDLRWRVGA